MLPTATSPADDNIEPSIVKVAVAGEVTDTQQQQAQRTDVADQINSAR